MDNYKKGQVACDKKDYVQAVSLWKPLAKEGDIEAINSMGNLYATEDIKKVNMFSRILKSINFIIWGDI